MGLAAPRKRRKISHDPNNTAWTRSQGFGHSVLVSQGWTPGQGLGRENAQYGEQQLRDGFSPLKAALRDDNRGLGASQMGERSLGLDVLQSVLGRLNGKSNGELEKEERARQNVRSKIWADLKWGKVKFVKGELLGGSGEVTPVTSVEGGEDGGVGNGKGQALAESDAEPDDLKLGKDKKARREKKDKKKRDKEARKRERHEAKAARLSNTVAELEPKTGRKELAEVDEPKQVPTSSPAMAPRAPPARHHVRQRYIQQKRMAMMDPVALKEILMGQT